MNYICFDIGGTSIKFGIADKNGKMLLKGGMANEIRTMGVNHFIDSLVSVTGSYRQRYDLQGIGVSTAGIVDPYKGIVLDDSGFFSPNFSLRELVEQNCGLPCTVENDVNAAALGEYWLGEGRGAGSLFCIALGFGIGGASIIDGKLIRGTSFCAGEVGRQYVGAKDRWELMVPTSVLVSNVAKAKGLPAAELNGKKVFSMAQEGDVDAITCIEKQMEILAAGIANICYVLNPERIIVGGGISEQANYLYPLLDKALRTRLIPLIYDNTSLRFAGLKNDAGMIGALYHFLQIHG
jgi:predicted NBD/HSP70 family sugar kinase